jgi:hypothetical protein
LNNILQVFPGQCDVIFKVPEWKTVACYFFPLINTCVVPVTQQCPFCLFQLPASCHLCAYFFFLTAICRLTYPRCLICACRRQSFGFRRRKSALAEVSSGIVALEIGFQACRSPLRFLCVQSVVNPSLIGNG